jgi:hypothetical protein
MSNNTKIFLSLYQNKTNEKIIEVLREIVNGKRNRLERKFTNKCHYEMFKHIPLTPTRIIVSENYMILEYERTIMRRWDSYKHSTYYVIGINSDGKLFINKLDTGIPYRVWTGRLNMKNGKNVELYTTNDHAVHHILGYQADLENMMDKTIPQYNENGEICQSYRIQGDLCLIIDTDRDVYNYYLGWIKHSTYDQIERILKRTILLRISNILNSYNIVTAIGNDRIAIEAIPRYLDDYEIKGILNKIRDILYSELYISDIAPTLQIENIYRDWNSKYSGTDIYITLTMGRGSYGEPYKPIVISVDISEQTVRKFVDHVLKDLELKSDRRVIYHGRHKITYNGYPSQMTLATQLPLLNLDGVENTHVLNINIDRVYLDEGELRIDHVEHGSYTYKIAKPLLVRFQSTIVDPLNDNRLSYYALKNLKT